jgi:hypothetical protein
LGLEEESLLTEADILGAAARLAASADQPSPVKAIQLAGGKNNRVFRLDIPQRGALILKSYFTSPHDPRDRLAAEWSFMTYAWRRGVRTIPQPLACEPETSCGLYTFASGRKLAFGEIGQAHVDAAIDFILAINAAPRDVTALRRGSEACFSLAEHVATVDRRVKRLAALDPDAPGAKVAEHFVANRLLPAWTAVATRLEREAGRLGISFDAKISSSDIVASPSDFGFHNALVAEHDRVTFIDFEYAGHDDPAKLVCDFFCQPEIPISIAYFDQFAERLVSGLALEAIQHVRCRLLLDAYRVKWACILLNDFLSVGGSRRVFANARSERYATQIAKAEAKIAEVTT